MDAEHEETAPGAPNLVISKLACALVGQEEWVQIVPGTMAARIYGEKAEVLESFRCSYGLNVDFLPLLEASELVVSGVDSGGDVRMVELKDHFFYTATLFLPQLSSRPGKPHPLVAAFLRAAAVF